MIDFQSSLTWNQKPTSTGMVVPVFGSTAGEPVTHRTASTVSSYYAAIRNVSEDIGKLPTSIFRVDAKENKTKAKDVSAYRLLAVQANPFMSAMIFKELLNSWAQGWGNGFAEIEFDKRMNPLALWPIHPARVQPYITDDRRLLYFVYPDFDIRGTKVIKLGDPIILADYQMIHIKGPTEYGVWGKSVLQAMSESVGISIAAQKYGAAFYGNGAHAGGYLEHPANMGSEAISRLREQIQENHKGAGKSGSLMVLEEGMKFSSNTVSPKDAQALELRQFEVAEIARWFRIQPHKLQDLTRATYSNIESQNLDYVTDTLLSWTTRWEQELHIKLLGGVDDLLVKFDFDFLLRGDRAARASYFSTMRFMGAINVNEIRRAEDMNDIGPKGDEYHQQSAMVPLGQVPEQKTNSFDGLAKNTAARIAQKEIKACQAEIKKERDHSEWIASFWLDQFGYAISSFLPIVETMAGLKLLDGPETIKALDETMKNFYSNRSTTPSTADQIFEAFRASQRH